MSAAERISAVYRYAPPADAEPIPVVRHGVRGAVLGQIHPGTCELRVTVHEAVGVHAEVLGPALHEQSGRAIATECLSANWAPEGRNHYADLAEAPQWVQDAVREAVGTRAMVRLAGNHPEEYAQLQAALVGAPS